MRRKSKIFGSVLVGLCAGIICYGGLGYVDARKGAKDFEARADELISRGSGGADLGAGRLALLLKVQDPNFYEHNGLDYSSAGAGITTLTQSLSKRLGFEDFEPGIGKIRQIGFALGIDGVLSKDQQVALFLQTAEMGRGPNGWVTGFFEASDVFFSKPVSELSDDEFTRLVAVLIAPSQLRLGDKNDALENRVTRIKKLFANACKPDGWRDVWLDSCA